jgi:hypothetical protein
MDIDGLIRAGFILDSTGCLCAVARIDMGKKAKPATVQGVGSEMRVIYPDARLQPSKCIRTGMRREFCPCEPCRALRRKKHRATCQCWLCYADRMGGFIDSLGKRTEAGGWLWFLTLTFRTPSFPWARGYPIEQPQPAPDFVHNFFARMIQWIEREVHARVEYFVVDQFGEVGGRLHQHCGLSWSGLFEYRWKDLQQKLCNEAGFNRILPWERDAGYYIGRYIGRDAERCSWDFRIAQQETVPRLLVPVGRRVVAVSAVPDNSSREFRKTLGSWHR